MWNKQNTWMKTDNHRGFAVEIKQWSRPGLTEKEEAKWNVYVYIWDVCPLYAQSKEIPNDDYSHVFMKDMPLHWGCTLIQQYKAGENGGTKIGSDYCHYGDNYEQSWELPPEIQADADALYAYMEKQVDMILTGGDDVQSEG